jgi:hypothetical protein
MEQSDILEIDCTVEDIKILEGSTEKFKRVHKVDFDSYFDIEREKFVMDLKGVSPNSIFFIGYYYGALQYIDGKKNPS